MLKDIVKMWDTNKHLLEEDIKNNTEEYNHISYGGLVEKVVELVLNKYLDDNYDTTYNTKNITEIDNGDYQGTLLYLIPLDTYQPSGYDYLMTQVSYGSCSGCDTLQSIQCWGEIENTEQFIKDFMTLALHLIQNMIRPYGD